ncbi:MAG TPA: ABC transporter permease [bacterium]|nr:ABC transporter permease [bacterium]
MQIDAAADPELVATAIRSVAVSGSATLLAALAGIPAGVAIAASHARGKRALTALLTAGMGMPTVLVGLVLMLLLWREGPLGEWALLYTPAALVLGQTVIAFPVVAALTIAAVDALPARVDRQILALGASPVQRGRLLAREARRGIVVALLAGFGHALSEVGAAMMLGGNVPGRTRVLTTATLQYARMGEFQLAIGLAAVLFAIALLVNASAALLSGGERE